eukprot:9429368-Pyramimonas_sp.AAC.1
MGMGGTSAEEVGAELRLLASALAAERRCAAGALCSQHVDEATEQWRRRFTSEALSLSRRAARCRMGWGTEAGAWYRGPLPVGRSGSESGKLPGVKEA